MPFKDSEKQKEACKKSNQKWRKTHIKEYRKKNKKKLRDYAKQYQRDNYKRDKEKILGYHKTYRVKIRLQCLVHYAGNPPKCACCGEKHIEFLSIDHINGGGVKHRKQLGAKWTIYAWLKKNNFPKGYRILCHNCNLSKGFYGYCPHEREIEILEKEVFNPT